MEDSKYLKTALSEEKIKEIHKFLGFLDDKKSTKEEYPPTGLMKPLDIVRTPTGDIGVITETNNKGTQASVTYLKKCHEGRSHNAWWEEGDGLVILDNLPRLLSIAMAHPFGRGGTDVEHFFGEE